MSAEDYEIKAGVAQSLRNWLQAWQTKNYVPSRNRIVFHCYNVPHSFANLSQG
jgi:hypothetical protein